VMRYMAYQPWVGLPNILAREFLVPELLQDAATPQALADAVWQQLQQDPAPLRLRFEEMHRSLLRNTADESAQAVLSVLQQAGKVS
jgi:lipid-A-disaccharide synthase